MQLSAQSILRLCKSEKPLIMPFTPEKWIFNGKSYGLSGASYDVRIAHDLTLGPNPVFLLAEMARTWPTSKWLVPDWAQKLGNYPPSKALAHTLEDFDIPDNVVGYVIDKSSYARVFVSAFNTLLDPGWRGNLTLELVNLGSEVIDIKAGDPIVQIAFHWLDENTIHPYRGKYYDQTKEAHGPRYE